MARRALQLASVASMIDQFNIPNIEILQSLGYKVDVIADFTNPGTITHERTEELKNRLLKMGVKVFDVAIPRTLNLIAILKALRKVKNILVARHYSIIHCHSPIGGAICRIAAKHERKNGAKVIYTAHGFHFFDGAPKKNWYIYYPVEKILSHYTDLLITINHEDYQRAKRNFHANRTVYIPGVGVDITKFISCTINRHQKRSELGCSENDFVLLSVGELSQRKNQRVVVEAIKGIQDLPIKYLLVGLGPLENDLRSLVRSLKLDDKVIFLGFRTDVNEILSASDVFVFPSFQEGLPVALMEAMAAGKPVICSSIRGNTDLIKDGQGGYLFSPDNYMQLAKQIEKMQLPEKRLKMGTINQINVRKFSKTAIEREMAEIYSVIQPSAKGR